jgi:DNA-directed RNA polymerase subunit RPC12/RpoP
MNTQELCRAINGELDFKKANEVLKAAFKELDQEHECCEDAISRKDIYFKLTNGAYPNETIEQFINRLVKELKALPSATPTHKKGKWEQYGNYWEDKFKCSECGKEQPKILCGERIIGHWSDYCPNCGAKMEVEE